MSSILHFLMASIAAVQGMVGQPGAVVVTPQPTAQTAVIRSAMLPLPVVQIASSSEASSSKQQLSDDEIVPGLLPTPKPKDVVFKKIILPSQASSSLDLLKKASVAAALLKTQNPLAPVKPDLKPSTLGTTLKQLLSTTSSVTSFAISAQTLLDHTTVSLKQGLKSVERVTFKTDTGTGAGGIISWNLLNTTIGGSGGVPQFTTNVICDPAPTSPVAEDIDQSPIFAVRTYYTCNVTLAATSGVDRRAVSKDFKFETDPGRLVISGVANGTTLLQDGENDGGFVFDNQDSQPMTITGLTIDASFTALTTSSPLVLRFTDPKTGSSLFDYHLETAPTDPTAEYTESQVGISIPLSFTIAGNTSKMLPVEALGVHKWQLSGTSPAVQVVLRAAKLQQANIKTFFVSPQIVWMCAVPVGGYNPFATSSAFLNGEACVN